MGLDLNGSRFLLYAKTLGVNFESTAMIGRQSLNLNILQLESAFKDLHQPIDKQTVKSLLLENGGYAESFFKHIGAVQVDSFDNSDFEAATHIHDMNDPIPEEYKNRYSVVLDGGALEHVFNFPVALKNCMEMVAVGGHYVAFTPANNLMGHGFYQISPELYFRVFNDCNGYALIAMVVYEEKPSAPWYAVKDPKQVGGRVTLINKFPTNIMVIAKKVRASEILATTPQQSDYVSRWDNSSEELDKTRKYKEQKVSQLFLRARLRAFERFIRHSIKDFRGLFRSKYDPRFFELIDYKKRR